MKPFVCAAFLLIAAVGCSQPVGDAAYVFALSLRQATGRHNFEAVESVIAAAGEEEALTAGEMAELRRIAELSSDGRWAEASQAADAILQTRDDR